MRAIQAAALAVLAALAALWQPATAAQEGAYPSRAVRVVVPFPPGGATDIMVRSVAQRLSEAWNQQVMVENRAGASGMIGAEAVAKSPGDGHTILAATIIHATNVSLFPNAPYRLENDLQAVSILGLIPLVAVVPATSRFKSLKELIDTSRVARVNAGSSGNGSAAHLTLEMFNHQTGAKILHVPYKGGAPAMVDLVGGQLDLIFALLPECASHIRSGKLRALATTTRTRHALIPDVPTSGDAGVPELVVTSWNGLMVPSSTPMGVVSKINADVRRLMGAPEVRRRIVEQGFEPVSLSVAEAERFVSEDVARWSKVVRQANIRVD